MLASLKSIILSSWLAFVNRFGKGFSNAYCK